MKKNIGSKQTLKEFLSTEFPDSSMSTFRKWLKNGRIFLDNQNISRLDYELEKGQLFEIRQAQRSLSANAKVIHETEDFIVIDKPHALLSVDKDHSPELSLHKILKRYLYPRKVFVVHRLDKETSGLILFAKKEAFFEEAKKQLKERKVKRKYLAILEGKLSPDQGKWENSLYEDNNLVMRVEKTPSPNGITATTFYKVCAESQTLSLVEFELQTGRKNQIRVQSQFHNCPILGDKKYGSKTAKKQKRMFLHAYNLSFSYAGKDFSFTSPIPNVFNQLIPMKEDAQ
ncbi:MAG: hypothetical protein GWP59_02840 [Chlamydiales bacterium]|nr:hypothetical protein [Chlamydiales bacterium]